MTWNEIGEWVVSTSEILIPASFTSRLAIKATKITNLRPTWDWSGFFYQYLELDPVGQVRIDKKINVPTREVVLFTPESSQPSYNLKFIKAGWISSLTLTIYEDSMPLTFEPVVNIPSTTASTAAGFTIPISAASVSLLAANPNRKKLVLANNTNQDLYIDLDAFASIADHCIKIPKISPNGFIASYELASYTGVVSGVWAATGTGAALIREMI
jgi:hypothetical protein